MQEEPSLAQVKTSLASCLDGLLQPNLDGHMLTAGQQAECFQGFYLVCLIKEVTDFGTSLEVMIDSNISELQRPSALTRLMVQSVLVLPGRIVLPGPC